ncbi:unnamed protein product [Ceutorhynchus assimilis]|uniref:Uncharacterized protein n=1 Tax=Ceutorhynchus assimilis TaxID=467358 RepID=A0A9N9MDX4_9CUCU|nr:unnamed protein product [Ceutorhynchus assimilis]
MWFNLGLVCLTLFNVASASFLYGQPCSDRNTAYLYPNDWIIPENSTNCIDITKSGNPVAGNRTDFFKLVNQADTLYADHMSLDRFPTAIVYVLPRLEMLDLSGNEIRRLPYKMYKVMPRVTKMLLPENAVFVPRKRPLFKSVSIKMLMLSKNRIQNIYPGTFSKMPNLQILYLDGNRLKFISPDMFLPMSRLLFLHLGGNAIEEAPPKHLMPLLLKFYIIKDQKKVIK